MNDQQHKTALPPRRSNMPITVMHRIELGCAWMLLGFFKIIGVDLASWLAGKTLRYIGPWVKKISQRGENNLRYVYPDWPDHQIKKTIADVWENLGRTSAEFSHLDKFSPHWDKNEMTVTIETLLAKGKITPKQAERMNAFTPKSSHSRVKVKASEDLILAIAQEKPVIFTTGHFANWEIMSVICDYFNIPCAIIYRATNNPLIDELIIKQRGKSVSHRHIPKGPDGARAFIDALKDKYSLALLMDQKYNNGVSVPFMGHNAMTAPAAARMALNMKLPIIPVSVYRTKGAHFIMTAQDKITYTPSHNQSVDIIAITTLINQSLEKAIREHPGQWLWFHRRWPKNKPTKNTEQ